MGSYRNPAMIVDTESGKFIQDLQSNITSAFTGYIKDKDARQKELAKEIKANKEKDVEFQKLSANDIAKINSGISKLAEKDRVTDWGAAFNADTMQTVTDASLRFQRGTSDDLIRDKLIVSQTDNMPDKFLSMTADNLELIEDYTKRSQMPPNKEGGYYMGSSKDSPYGKRVNLFRAQTKALPGYEARPYIDIDLNSKDKNYVTGGMKHSWIENGQRVEMPITQNELDQALTSMGSFVPIVQDELRNGEFNKIKLGVTGLFNVTSRTNKDGGTDKTIDENIDQGFNFDSPLLTNKKSVKVSGPDKDYTYYRQVATLNKIELEENADWKRDVAARAEVLMKGHGGIDAVALANSVFPENATKYEDTETFMDEEKSKAFISDYSKYLLSKLPNTVTRTELDKTPLESETADGSGKPTAEQKKQADYNAQVERVMATGGLLRGPDGFEIQVTKNEDGTASYRPIYRDQNSIAKYKFLKEKDRSKVKREMLDRIGYTGKFREVAPLQGDNPVYSEQGQ